MGLAPADRRRFARHLALAEVGEAGQARILDARVALGDEGDPGAREVAALYLTRSGATVEGIGQSPGEVAARTVDEAAVLAIAGDGLLLEAARGLAGALTAVEVLKGVIGLEAKPVSALDVPCLGPETDGQEPHGRC
jgi:hypothetical protein